MKNFGVYNAIVLDNTDFYKTGKINIKIDHLNIEEPLLDLRELSNLSEYLRTLRDSGECPCSVFSPFGGGENNGMFALPLIGARGLVQFINGEINSPVWMGTVFTATHDAGNTTINIPNDDPDVEGDGNNGVQDWAGSNRIAVQNQDGSIAGRPNVNTQFVFRTKSNSRPIDGQRFKVENFEFGKNLTDNMTLWTKTKMMFRHFGKWAPNGNFKKAPPEEYTELTLHNDGSIKVTSCFKDGIFLCKNEVVVNKAEINCTIQDPNTKKENSVIVNRTNVTISAINQSPASRSDVVVTGTEITLSSMGSSIVVAKDLVTITGAKNVAIGPGADGTLQLASGGGYVVTSPNPLWSVQASDGSIATANSKLRG